MGDRRGPLAGVRVVDLTALVMGPYCTQIMADMGADVIKVESADGDNARVISVGPAPDMGGVFANVNRGKRSVVLDLKSPAGKAALTRLIADADVFIHSMRSKAIARLGLDYQAVQAIRPDIVYTNCYGYSRRGPKADGAAYDDTIQAECGIPAVQAELTGQASYAGTILADKVAGLTALYATMMALFHKERTGEGQEVEIGMFETMASFMLVEHANGMIFDPPLGRAVYPRAVNPERRPYRTSDGYIAVLVYNDRQWRTFFDAVQPAWRDDPRFATLAGRVAYLDELYAKLAAILAERTTEEWIALLRPAGIPVSRVNAPEDLLTDAHLEEIGFFETVDSSYGPMRFPGIPTWFGKTPGRIVRGAPGLGEHTRSVLREAGIVDTDIDALTREGVHVATESDLPC
ncbi:CoA transferase [Sphingobium aromaticivastans]|uniref:CaiB/BaiF CoA transferase family protein n=1 Tax=Sphingobium aromaticivastans TaxID=1778665 RepID=UPI0030194F90